MKQIEQPKQELGFVLYPARRLTEPGYPRVDIHLCRKPTGEHFDPEALIVDVISPTLGLETLRIHHPWHATANYKLAPGQIHLESNTGKGIDALTFGGEMSVSVTPDCTTIVLRSKAPILFNYPENSPARLLADEVEILLAERRAAGVDNPEVYEQRLGDVNPIQLYLACLIAVEARFHQQPPASQEVRSKLLHLLRDERQAFESEDGSAETTPLDLADLL